MNESGLTCPAIRPTHSHVETARERVSEMLSIHTLVWIRARTHASLNIPAPEHHQRSRDTLHWSFVVPFALVIVLTFLTITTIFASVITAIVVVAATIVFVLVIAVALVTGAPVLGLFIVVVTIVAAMLATVIVVIINVAITFIVAALILIALISTSGVIFIVSAPIVSIRVL